MHSVPVIRQSPKLGATFSRPELTSSSAENQRLKRKERNISHHFIYTNGRKHHNSASSNVPYPLDYELETVDLDILDHLFLKSYKGISFIDFSGRKLPARVLDIGCGTGAWVLEAAKIWPECHFVGLDIMPLQPNLARIGLAGRVKWVRANFLHRLPFDDDYFDHVHIHAIAKGVPENMWDPLFEEVTRILAPDGSFEMIEEDITFPRPLRSCTGFRHLSQSSFSASNPVPATLTRTNSVASTTSSPYLSHLSHDHALLEHLYFSVFETRFINLQPTAILLNCINVHFRRTLCTPPTHFPYPPIPQDEGFNSASNNRTSSDSTYLRPEASPQNATSEKPSDCLSPISNGSRTSSEQYWSSLDTNTSQSSIDVPLSSRVHCSYPDIPGISSLSIIPTAGHQLQDYALAIHLHRTWQGVLGCREAMFQEFLKKKGAGEMSKLVEMGWDDVDQSDDRAKFDMLCEHYADDMRRQTALDVAIEQSLQWNKPARDPPTIAEQAWLDSLDRELAALRQLEKGLGQPRSRTIRAFCGFKGGQWS